ncbi:MAG: trehalose-phosphatase [Bdellovibrionales bacterium]|nr:trehalose-phosphatase [Bdellovibrionales bacterium]
MKPLLQKSGLQVLESLSFTDTLYAFDFDGTLAPIVNSPTSARAPEKIESLLSKLAQQVPVVVISGRSILDLKTRIRASSIRLIGNHGLEGLTTRKGALDRARKVCVQWKAQLQKGWKPLRADPGVFIEDKEFSLALHYRKSRNKKEARAALFSLISTLEHPPRVILGKCVMNLVPAGGPHKGVALLEAMVKLGTKCAFYIGDDDTDEDVFTLPDTRIIAARVGRKKNSQAQYFLQRQSEMTALLKKLVQLTADSRSK